MDSIFVDDLQLLAIRQRRILEERYQSVLFLYQTGRTFVVGFVSFLVFSFARSLSQFFFRSTSISSSG